MTQIAHPERAIPREALAAAGVAATLAAALAWFGPPGSDFAAHLYQSGVFEDHGFADLEQLLVRRALQLRHLQPSLLPARGPSRDQAARRRERRDGRARVRGRRGARMGPRRALVEPLLRRRVGGSRALGRLPVRARHGAGAARALGAAGGTARPLRAPDGARARGEPGGVRPARRDPRRASGSRGRHAGPSSRSRSARSPSRPAVELVLLRLFPAGGRFPFSLSEFARGVRVLRPRHPAHVARAHGRGAPVDVRRLSRRLHRRVSRPVGPGREHRAAALRGDPDRDPDALAATLAAAAARGPRALARGRLEPHSARRQLRQDERRPGGRPGLLGPGGAVPPRPSLARRTASRRSTRSATGPPPTSPQRGSRSRGAGSGRTTSRATASSTRSSTAPATWPGSARSASGTSSCPTPRSTTAPSRRAP